MHGGMWVARCNRSVIKSDFKFDSRFGEWRENTGFGRLKEIDFVPAELSAPALLKQLVEEFVPHDWDSSLYNPVVENFIYEFFKPYMVGARELTVNEAIHGCADLNVPPMDLTTSVGYGLSKFYKSKHDLMLTNPWLAIYLAETDWEAATRRVELPIWFHKASLKDELRATEKVAESKTRVFIASPYVYTITERRLYGAICGLFARASTTHVFPGAIGEDFYRGGWARMMAYLTKDGEFSTLGDGDVKMWDKHHQVFWRLLNIMLYGRWLNSEELYNKLIWQEFRSSQSWVIAGAVGHAYTSNTGYKSGRGDTGDNNSISNFRVHVTVFFELLRKHCVEDEFSIARFNEWYRVKVLGDDNAYGCATWLGLDFPFVVETYRRFGWECLPNHDDETTILTLDFAGRKSIFIPEFETLWPVIPLKRILHINYWGRDLGSTDVTQQRADAAANMAFPYLWSTDENRRETAALLLYYHFVMGPSPSQSRHHLSDYAQLYLEPGVFSDWFIKDSILERIKMIHLDERLEKQLIRYL